MEDKNIGRVMGIFKIVEATTEREKYGHLLYVGECIYCGKKVKRRLVDMKNVSICTHKKYNDGLEQSHPYIWKICKLQKVFHDMKLRCYNPNNKAYRWYGAKGIKVCDEWILEPSKFEEWAIKSGYADGLTIDRIDSNGDYEPDNCRWLTQEDNSRRAGRVNWITVGNETLTGKQWATKLGCGINRVNKLIRTKGIEAAIKFIEAELSKQQTNNQN